MGFVEPEVEQGKCGSSRGSESAELPGVAAKTLVSDGQFVKQEIWPPKQERSKAIRDE